MSMTPNERAEQEAREIIGKWTVEHNSICPLVEKQRMELISAITSALLLKYKFLEKIHKGCAARSTIQKIGGGR